MIDDNPVSDGLYYSAPEWCLLKTMRYIANPEEERPAYLTALARDALERHQNLMQIQAGPQGPFEPVKVLVSIDTLRRWRGSMFWLEGYLASEKEEMPRQLAETLSQIETAIGAG